MRRTFTTTLLALACAAALAGCRGDRTEGGIGAYAGGSSDLSVEAVIRQLRDFTEELASKVESAPDPKAAGGPDECYNRKAGLAIAASTPEIIHLVA